MMKTTISIAAQQEQASSDTTTTVTTGNVHVPHVTNRGGRPVLLPKSYVPDKYTVICGRGRICTNASGNKYLSTVINGCLQAYSQCNNKTQKSEIVSLILVKLKQAASTEADAGSSSTVDIDDSSDNNNSNMVLFVKIDDQGRFWQVNDSVGREKIGGILRDRLHAQYKSSSKSKIAKRKAMQEQIQKISDDTNDNKSNKTKKSQTMIESMYCAKTNQIQEQQQQPQHYLYQQQQMKLQQQQQQQLLANGYLPQTMNVATAAASASYPINASSTNAAATQPYSLFRGSGGCSSSSSSRNDDHVPLLYSDTSFLESDGQSCINGASAASTYTNTTSVNSNTLPNTFIPMNANGLFQSSWNNNNNGHHNNNIVHVLDEACGIVSKSRRERLNSSSQMTNLFGNDEDVTRLFAAAAPCSTNTTEFVSSSRSSMSLGLHDTTTDHDWDAIF